ncbi:hypothetical protein PVAND_017469 [Polypedilum vanderplanki]|uniref:Uncharacterized protein n=1 Tax=Polypedilum vanderplanki TaxID=319348 RepID=A0A9J6BJL7_POLVA|nr:hypothetical protein PVAND_017469 [Polypedilum vanderplanki]
MIKLSLNILINFLIFSSSNAAIYKCDFKINLFLSLNENFYECENFNNGKDNENYHLADIGPEIYYGRIPEIKLRYAYEIENSTSNFNRISRNLTVIDNETSTINENQKSILNLKSHQIPLDKIEMVYQDQFQNIHSVGNKLMQDILHHHTMEDLRKIKVGVRMKFMEVAEKQCKSLWEKKTEIENLVKFIEREKCHLISTTTSTTTKLMLITTQKTKFSDEKSHKTKKAIFNFACLFLSTLTAFIDCSKY